MIVLNVIVLLALLIPTVRGYVNGFVKTALHFFRFLIAFVLACIFSKPLGGWIKGVWLEERFYNLIDSSVRKSFDGTAESLADAVPSGSRALLESVNFNISGVASDAVSSGESVLEGFVRAVSDNLASVVSVILAFIGIFIVSFFALFFVAKILTFIVDKIPFIRGINRFAGLGIGFVIGIFTAWTVAQFLVFALTTFTAVDYSQAALLNFFHDISPLRWFFKLMARGLSITVV